MEARAYQKYLRISPRKVKIVCDLIRGVDAETAIAYLKATPKAVQVFTVLYKPPSISAKHVGLVLPEHAVHLEHSLHSSLADKGQ